MEPKPIEPQDIRVGDRVRCEWTTDDVQESAEFVVIRRSSHWVASQSRTWGFGKTSTWTLLDRPEPARPVGSHWRDPETGAEYVKTDRASRHDAQYLAYAHGYAAGIDAALVPDFTLKDAAIIARLTPIPAFDPAALWPAVVGYGPRCGERNGVNTLSCSRPYDHDSLHAAYAGHEDGAENLRYVWGDPR